jgi:hypothetical protein
VQIRLPFGASDGRISLSNSSSSSSAKRRKGGKVLRASGVMLAREARRNPAGVRLRTGDPVPLAEV